MVSRRHTALFGQRLMALAAAAVTLWTVAITAGSKIAMSLPWGI